MSPNVLLILLALPFLGALLLLLARGKAQDWLAVLLPTTSLAVGLWVAFGGLAAFPLKATLTSLPWLESAGTLTLRLDALSAILLLVVLVVGLAVMAFSVPYMGPANRDHPVVNHEGNGRYYFFLSLFVGAMVGIALAGNLLLMFFFWEITTLCSWALISHNTGSPEAIRAGFKALLMTNAGGVFFAAAIAILYALTGSFEFSAIGTLAPGPMGLVFLFLLIAAGTKSAQFPVFTWLPDAMTAPTPISAYLHAAAMVKAGVYLMARVILDTGTLPTWGGGLLAGVALVTTVVGIILYFFQDDLKRFLAYSTIVQLGYIMLGLSLLLLGSRTGYLAGVLHIACHSVAKALLFLCVGFMAMRLGVKKMSGISGLYTKMPITAIAFFIGLMAVTGIPPFSCFWSKLGLVLGILELKGVAGPLIAVPFFLEVVVAFLWFLRVGQGVLFGAPSEAVAAIGHDRSEPGAAWVNGILLALVALTLVMPAIAYPFLREIF